MIGSPMPNDPANQHAKPCPQSRWFGLVVSLALGLLLMLPSPCWAAAATALAPSRPTGRLQESAPPPAVQQLQQELRDLQPQISILSPRGGTVLPAGPWELSLRIQDWPLVDAGALGLGPHVVVQIDAQQPLRIAGETDGVNVIRSDALGRESRVVLQLPALSPGSHRITAYAARPWGEAVKSPGALSQITVHRVAANPIALPAAGSPQLLPASPAELSRGEPVLLDWLLLNAPLQNLRPGDGSWRLRITINGDSFLVDQNVPLWLRGWRPGSNSLLLELLDGLGEPLNPPFNSLVQEVDLGAGNGAGPRPRWLQGRLESDELAALLGLAPAAAADAADAAKPQAAQHDDAAAAVREPDAGAAVTTINANDNDRDSDKQVDNEERDEPPPQSSEPMPSEASAPEPASSEHVEPDQAEPSEPSPEISTTASPPAPELAALPLPPPERISSTTPLGGTARDQVNADGSLIKPRPSGPLSGLRQRIGA